VVPRFYILAASAASALALRLVAVDRREAALVLVDLLLARAPNPAVGVPRYNVRSQLLVLVEAAATPPANPAALRSHHYSSGFPSRRHSADLALTERSIADWSRTSFALGFSA
jgi:hypothetical protein